MQHIIVQQLFIVLWKLFVFILCCKCNPIFFKMKEEIFEYLCYPFILQQIMTTKITIPDFRNTPTVDQVGIEERVARFSTRSIKKGSKMEGLKMALNMIDLTTLEGKDTPGKVKQMCYKAMHLHDVIPGLPTVAAVCVYPSMVKTAKEALKGSNVKIASVSTAFPSGQSTHEIKIADTKFAIDNGADEIDMVISRGEFLSGNYNFVFDEIASIKEACGKIRLKVIFETGELSTLDNVRKVSDIAMYAGADFIKTSTGKISPAATMPVTLVMLEAIRDYYYATGRMVGMKPAGGISTSKLALQYLIMLNETLGADWLSNEWFRFGASSLANDILLQIAKETYGVYQSGDYFSKD
ncbi:MAG: deoxyribose-phosphate aldolase [Bacteroidetes bacterium]|nr:deoxyribose-phosphate aldolase [Bacteroidota bacterium]